MAMENLSNLQMLAIMAVMGFVGRLLSKFESGGAPNDAKRIIRVVIASLNSAFISVIAGAAMFASNQTNPWVLIGVAGVFGLIEREAAQSILMKFFNFDGGGNGKKD
jgi:hypothetical protein